VRKKIPAFICILLFFIPISCGKITDTPDGCVVAFIVACEERDMTKAWNHLGPDAQNYYNGLGEKQRRSGKGALENEVNRIKRFRNVKKDYKIVKDKDKPDLIKIMLIGDQEFNVETIDENGSYKIRDGNSVRNLLNGITAESEKGNGY
jgi:hypothetical protein